MKRFLIVLTGGFLGTLAAFFFLFALAAALLLGGDTTPKVRPGTVLELELAGGLEEVTPSDPFAEALGGGAPTLRELTEALEKAAADERIAAVWLRPEGLGAPPAMRAEVRRALERFRESGKPILASSGDAGFTEAGYYLASAADSVFAPPEAAFELNGFFLAVPFFAGTLEKLGIEPEVIRAGAYKSAAETFTHRAFSPENAEQYRDILRATAADFEAAVARGRPGVGAEEVRRLVAEGGLYEAREALEAGLLDGLRYEEEVREMLRALTGRKEGEALRTISLKDYARVPAAEAGLRPGKRENRIAVVYAVGQIVPGESRAAPGAGPFLGSESLAEALRTAQRDERVRAIVLRVDSPGGSAAASDAMWQAVREAARERPVVVSMGSVAASGGYYLAAAADTIVAEAATVTGSIGVISLLFDASAFLNERLGVSFDTLRTGPTAGLYDFSHPLSEAERGVLERQTERIYDVFVRRVADGRALAPDSVRALGGGRVYTGERAHQLGLVDEIGGLGRAIEIAAEMAGLEPGGYRLRILPREKPLLERLAEAFGAQAAALLGRPAGPAEAALRRHLALLEEARSLHASPQARLLVDLEVR